MVTHKNTQLPPLLNPLKTNEKIHFTTLNYISDYTLHPKIYISIKLDSKFDVGMQSVTRVIV